MKPTHQLRTGAHEDVTAWRFLKDAGMPRWVFRAFHDLGGGHHLTHRSGIKVNPGEWIVMLPDEATAIVLTDKEFNACFIELPKEILNGGPS